MARARELRGHRYLRKDNERFARFLVEDLHYLDYGDTMRWYATVAKYLDQPSRALLGCNDRYFLLTALCHRHDALHPWLFDRCREVEDDPDGYLDLWARYHYKSSICTFAGVIQEVMCDPEITVAILSCTNEVARPFLTQIQQEFETNELLKETYPDVLWADPRKEAPLWSKDEGITVKRRGNPKEATIEAFGLIDGMRTGKHYDLLDYDDLVTEKLVSNPEMIQKVTERWELSDNLGKHKGTRKWHEGTRYCTVGTMKILMDDWTHKPIQDVRVGDTVIGWELKNGKRWLRPSKVVNRGVHFDQPVNTYKFASGRSVTCTEDHRWWRGAHGSGAEYKPLRMPSQKRRSQGKRTAPGGIGHIRELLVPVERGEHRDAAWLAGFFDGEGTIKKNPNHPSATVCFVQTMSNPELIEETRSVLSRLGFQWSESWHKPSKVAGQEAWNDRCVFNINGGWRERYRFLAEVSPIRREKLAASLFGQLNTQKHKLVEVKSAGRETVHWLETETGNYVIEGFCSSNSFADSYGVILERGTLKERRYAATSDGTLKGEPVFLTPERWAEVQDAQRSTVSAQMLLNPVAGQEAMFLAEWLKGYEIIPAVMNVYIIVDPSKGKAERSDRTAIAVIGIDPAGNKYLLDGVRHRMKLSQRWQFLKQLYQHWLNFPGVQSISVGYEVYGMQIDDEIIEEKMEAEKFSFELIELNWTRDGKHSKTDRVSRLEPDLKGGRFYIPGVVWHPDLGARDGQALWSVTEEGQKIEYRPLQGATKLQRAAEATGQRGRIVTPIKRVDEVDNVYDLTRAFIEEMLFFPFAPKKDLIDAMSRIYDEKMGAKPPIQFERAATEPVIHLDT